MQVQLTSGGTLESRLLRPPQEVLAAIQQGDIKVEVRETSDEEYQRLNGPALRRYLKELTWPR